MASVRSAARRAGEVRLTVVHELLSSREAGSARACPSHVPSLGPARSSCSISCRGRFASLTARRGSGVTPVACAPLAEKLYIRHTWVSNHDARKPCAAGRGQVRRCSRPRALNRRRVSSTSSAAPVSPWCASSISRISSHHWTPGGSTSVNRRRGTAACSVDSTIRCHSSLSLACGASRKPAEFDEDPSSLLGTLDRDNARGADTDVLHAPSARAVTA
jgi:hypothetical protein